jgi:hypothetical protein
MKRLQLSGDTLLDERKNSKTRQLVRKLNNIRRIQKQKIDILCNDIIAAHGTFINHLKSFRFAADFYENLLDATSLNMLAASAGEFLAENIEDCSVAIIFTSPDAPEIHFYSKDPRLEDIPPHISPYLTARMVESVCQSSQICSSDELCRMGFFAGPAVLKRISLAAIGLNSTGPALGMILLYRSADKPLCDSELSQVASVVKGLSRAVKALRGARTCDSIA